MDIATQVPHAALRVFVMGERGADREPATEQDRAEMARLAAEGIKAGALGFSTSRTLNHKTLDGRSIPTLDAAEAELAAIAGALRDIGKGWMQVISDFDDVEDEFAMLRRLVDGVAPADGDHAIAARREARGVAPARRLDRRRAMQPGCRCSARC